MNNLVEENVHNNKCTQISTNMKNKCKKAKDSSEISDDLSITNQHTLTETLANSLYINSVNNSLSNGTSDHTNGSPEKKSDILDAQGQTPKEVVNDVNIIQCSDIASNQESTDSLDLHTISCCLDDALKNPDLPVDEQDQDLQDGINIISYESEIQMPEIMKLIQKDLSEPYSIYTYRYFIHNWPKLCFLATHEGKCIGAIVCKLDMHRNVVKRGYIAMLAVDKKYRKKGIGSKLVRKAIQVMINDNADEVVLETEITNKPALKLYENLGFVRDKRLFRYYLNGVDALRLKLWLR